MRDIWLGLSLISLLQYICIRHRLWIFFTICLFNLLSISVAVIIHRLIKDLSKAQFITNNLPHPNMQLLFLLLLRQTHQAYRGHLTVPPVGPGFPPGSQWNIWKLEYLKRFYIYKSIFLFINFDSCIKIFNSLHYKNFEVA